MDSEHEDLEELNTERAEYIFSKISEPILQSCMDEMQIIKDRVQNNEQSPNEPHKTNKRVFWKPFAEGHREMCDMCRTSSFNFHWVCEKCGFAVCIDCQKENENQKTKNIMLCNDNETAHDLGNLSLTQIIPGNLLEDFVKNIKATTTYFQIFKKEANDNVDKHNDKGNENVRNNAEGEDCLIKTIPYSKDDDPSDLEKKFQ